MRFDPKKLLEAFQSDAEEGGVEMRFGGGVVGQTSKVSLGVAAGRDEASDVWRTMIDEALK